MSRDHKTSDEPKDLFEVVIDGPGTELTKVDPVEAMTVALAYLELMRKASSHLQLPMQFEGLYLLPGSTAVATKPDNPAVAKSLAKTTARWVEGYETAPKEVRPAVDGVKRAFRAMPKEHIARVVYLDLSAVVIPREPPAISAPKEIVSLRATLISVGGVEPKARFASKLESEPFSLDITQAEARGLGAALYKELEITAIVLRVTDPDPKIKSGKLLDFTPVSDGDPVEAWRLWFRENAPHWNDVEDIEGALGRD